MALIQCANKSNEILEKLFLEAYAETDGNKYVNILRDRLYFIFNNQEDVVMDEDFPDTPPIKDMGRSWENDFSLHLGELKLKYQKQEDDNQCIFLGDFLVYFCYKKDTKK